MQDITYSQITTRSLLGVKPGQVSQLLNGWAYNFHVIISANL